MTDPMALTPSQQDTVDFYRDRLDATGMSPSFRELIAHFGFRSTNSARCRIVTLLAKGAIVRSGARNADRNYVPAGYRPPTLPQATDRPTLTKRQQEVLKHIIECRDKTGVATTFREIAASFGFTIRGSCCHVDALRRKGYLAPGTRLSRGLVPLASSD